MPIHLAMPWCLAGLLAVAAPLAVHLLATRVRRRVPFGAVRFLLAAAHTPVHHHRLRKLAVLTARCLLVAALVLALAGPYLGTPPQPKIQSATVNASTDDRPDAVVFILDNSASSKRPREDATVFLGLLSQTRRRLDALDPKRSAAAVILTAPRPAPLLPLLTPRLNSLRDQLDTAQPAQARGDLPAALRLAGRMFEQQRFESRRIVLLSDMQASTLDGEARDAVNALPPEIMLEVVPITGDAPPPPTLAAPTGPRRATLFTPTTLAVTATNHGPRDTSTDVTLTIDRLDTQSRRVTLPANRATTIAFDHAFQSPGEHAVSVTLTPKAGVSSQACWVVDAADRTRVVMIAPPDALRGPTGWAFILAAALSPDDHAPLAVKLVADTRATPDDVANADLLVFSDPSRLRKDVVDTLTQRAQRDAATLVVLDPRTSPNAFDAIPPSLAQSLPLTPEPPRSPPPQAPVRSLTINAPNPSHPFLTPLGGPVLHAFETTSIHTTPAPATAKSPPLLAYSDGTPALGIQGRTACLNLIPNLETSDLPRRPAFVALAQHLADRLMSTTPPTNPLHTGDPLPVTTLAGFDVTRTPRFADEPGVYTIETPESKTRLVAVNIDPRETAIETVSADTLLAKRASPTSRDTETFHTPSQTAARDIAAEQPPSRYQSLRGHCLAAAVIFLALESLLVGPAKRTITSAAPAVAGNATT